MQEQGRMSAVGGRTGHGQFPGRSRSLWQGFWALKINCCGRDTVPFTRVVPAAISLQRCWGKCFHFKPCRSGWKEVVIRMIYCSSPFTCFITGCKKVSTLDDDFICPMPWMSLLPSREARAIRNSSADQKPFLQIQPATWVQGRGTSTGLGDRKNKGLLGQVSR